MKYLALENTETKLKAYQKTFLAFAFIEGQLWMFKDNLKHEKKLALNNVIKTTDKFLKVVSKDMNIDKLENDLNADIDLITQMFDAFIQAEEKGFELAFKNGFYKLCADFGIKV